MVGEIAQKSIDRVTRVEIHVWIFSYVVKHNEC